MFLEMDKVELEREFSNNLLDTNRGFNYYVDWENITGYEKYNIELHAMDVLIGCTDFQNKFKELLKKVPTVIETFPFLFGLSKLERKFVTESDGVLKIIGAEIDGDDYQEYNFNVKNFDNKLDDQVIEKFYDFFRQMGLKYLFENLIERSTIDYIKGVLVGLDSNGRKNRGGKAFELACEPIIKALCDKYKLTLLIQKSFSALSEYGINVSLDMNKRRSDFIIVKGNKSLNIEVNFFNGGGSKPEEIIESYINRQNDLNKDKVGFALITDGACWDSSTNYQLIKGFRHLKYLMNFNLAKKGMLEEVIKTEFQLL